MRRTDRSLAVMDPPIADARRRHPFLGLAALVVIVAGAAALARGTALGELLEGERLRAMLHAARSSAWAPGLYVVLYAGMTAVGLPGSVITIAGGAVFGFSWGVLLVTIAANAGASAAFLIARVLGREGIQRLFGGRLKGLDRATAAHGFVGLLILRLIPLVPFNALNFGSGLTAMRWRTYALATAIGIVPGTLVYVFSADALMQGATGASAQARMRLLIAAGLFLVLTLVPLVARRLGLTASKPSRSERAR